MAEFMNKPKTETVTGHEHEPGRHPVTGQLRPARGDGDDDERPRRRHRLRLLPDLRNGAATTQTSFAVNSGRLYGVWLLNGQLTDLGQTGSTPVVTDLAIPLNQL